MSENRREFFDDPVIADADVLYRAVPPSLIDNRGSFSEQDDDIPSRAWQDQKEEEAARWGLLPCASVAVARILLGRDCDVESWLKNFFSSEYGVVETTAGEVRQSISPQGHPVPQGVMLHPTAEQPWHAVVWSKSGTKRTKAAMKALRLKSHWVRLPILG